MKKLSIAVTVLLALVGIGLLIHSPLPSVQAQYTPQIFGQNTLFANASAGPAGIVTNPSGLNVSVAPGPMFCSGDQFMLHNTTLGLLANQTWFIVLQCANNDVIARTTAPGVRPTEVPLATVVCGASTCGTITATTSTTDYPNTGDNFYWLPLNSFPGCQLALTTGAYAANPANSGALSAPSIVRVAANNVVLQTTSTAATNTNTLDCQITGPGDKTSTGKGILVTGLNVFYGVQTTALTSIVATPTLDTVTYSASIGSATAAGTVAAAGGTLTFNPVIGSSNLALTTSGQCFWQQVTLATPVQLNTQNVSLTFEEQFAQSAAAATVLQICGVQVLYQSIPL